MKKIFLFIMAAFVSLSSLAWTVKFANNATWGELKIWAWGSADQLTSAGWPGDGMTSQGNNIWTYTGDDSKGSVNSAIFRSNGQNNEQIRVENVVKNGGVYSTNGECKYVLNGQVNDANGTTWTAKDLEYQSDGTWQLTATFAGGDFGIRIAQKSNGTQDGWIGGGSVTVAEADKAYTFKPGSNSKSTLAKGEYTVVYDPIKDTITFKSAGGGEEPIDPPTPPTPTAKDCYLVGDSPLDWSNKTDGYVFSFDEDTNLYTLHIDQAPESLKAKLHYDTDGYLSTTEAITSGSTYTLGDTGYAAGFDLSGLKNIDLTFNPDGKKLTLTFEKPAVDWSKYTYQIQGPAVGSWSTYKDLTDEDGDGVYTATLDIVAGEFGIPYKQNGSQKLWGWSTGTTEADYTISAEGTYNTCIQEESAGHNWKNNLSGKYLFEFDPANKTLTISDASVKKCFLVGPAPLDWNNQTAGYVFTKSGDNYTLHIDEAPETFKFKVNYDGKYLTTSDALVSGETYTLRDISVGGEMDLSGMKNIDLTFTPDNSLTLTFTAPVPDPVIPDNDDEYTYLCINMANDWLTKYDTSFVPHCHVYNTANNNKLNGDDWGKEAQEMELLVNQVWGYKVKTADLADYNAAIFYVKEKDSDQYVEYNTNKREGASDFDQANWTKYIYTPAAWDYNFGTRQSYMTLAQLKEVEATKAEKLYLVGEGLDGLSDWSMSSLEDPVEGTNVYSADNQCFYIDVPVSNNAKFKISRVNPYIVARENGIEGELNNNRMWASFNQGVIGIDNANPVMEKINVTVDTDHNDVTFEPRVTIPYNRWNQFDWKLDTSKFAEGETISEPYIVVDANEKTLTLIMFDPNPSIVATTNEVEVETVSYEDAAKLHSGDAHHLSACEHNGHQLFDAYNVASGEVTIDGATGAEFYDHFDVVYTVSMNGREMLKTSIVDKPFDVDYMAQGQSDALAARARYVNKDSGLAFHSRTGKGTLTSNAGVELAQPDVWVVKSQHIVATVPDENGLYNVHAVAECLYDNYFVKETGLAHFFDFEVECNGAKSAYLLSEDMMGRMKECEIKPLAGWEKNDEIDGFHSGNAWSKNIAESESGVFPIFIPNVKKVADPENLGDTEIKVTATAIYPFLVKPNTTLTVQKSNKRRINGNVSDFSIINVPVNSDTATHEVKGNNVVTSIDAVEIDNNAEVKYFNLQGQRVLNPTVGGMYIRVQGNQATKIAL